MGRKKSEGEIKSHQQHLLMAPSEIEAIDDWAFEHRIRSRGEAIRRLAQMGRVADELVPEILRTMLNFQNPDDDPLLYLKDRQLILVRVAALVLQMAPIGRGKDFLRGLGLQQDLSEQLSKMDLTSAPDQRIVADWLRALSGQDDPRSEATKSEGEPTPSRSAPEPASPRPLIRRSSKKLVRPEKPKKSP